MDLFIRQNKTFLGIIALVLTICLYITASTEKGNLHLLINQWHTPLADKFFISITVVGNGLSLVVILLLIYPYVNVRTIVGLFIAFLISSILVLLCKQVLFPDIDRPVALIGKAHLYLLPDVRIFHSHTFPSGHATTASVLFLYLSTLTTRTWLQAFYAFFTITVAFSRVYLSLHFLEDIIAGIFIGIISVAIAFLIVKRQFKTSSKWNKPIARFHLITW
ncbi:MAG TPA: phosphatase PAP2 family protein [Saprospiraceae bacterium]|nr:phosphatase PAP2 family protein [Saprospiraceae bacterium]